MDEFNNDRNPFDEQSGGQTPYGQQEQQNPNPYAQQTPPNTDPYNQQSGQGSPYNGQPQQNPYNQYNQPSGGYYNQQNIPQGYGQPQGYGMPYQQMYMQKPSTGMATASMVLGIISIVLCIPAMVAPVLGIIPVIGLILGIVYKTKRLPVGKGFSTAGIIMSAIGILLPILLLILSLVFVMNNPDYVREYLNLLKETDPEQYQEYYDQLGGMFPDWFESVMFFIFK
ncbi:MAG: hypothetical protein NC253_08765 [Ruminococcus sp.]|nr:hypothetical protein [Ruminococcus sp.]MCM1380821.1 hypothetical protein [Muribaculaceae bacterium]MCM1480880.1 hypothetical protein [Muribaculaceae bacterium]